MKKIQFSTLLLAFLMIACFSCKQDGGEFEINYYSEADYQMMSQYIDIPEFPLDYTNQYPAYYRNSARGLFDKDMATLGRVLFYDKKLSADETISCASCHDQALAFADNVDLSIGIQDRRTGRNSLALGAVFNFQEYYGSASFSRITFFWDNRAISVQEQATQTFAAENEMGMDMDEVVAAVKELEYYAPLFEMAYGNRTITEDKVLDAMNTFVSSIGSYNSKYDEALDDAGFQLTGFGTEAPEQTSLGMLSDEENRGFQLYVNNCGSCHGHVNGVPGKIDANNGLDMNYEDNGTGELTNNPADMGKFKVPTLRNIMVTGPFMHDGRFETIEEVLDHYSSGIQNHENLDPELKDGTLPKLMNFSSEERADLIAFLNTFTDTEFLDANSEIGKKYSDPFKN